MKFTLQVTDIQPKYLRVWEVRYRVKGMGMSFNGIEYFENGLPTDLQELNRQTAERVREKIINEIHRLPTNSKFFISL